MKEYHQLLKIISKDTISTILLITIIEFHLILDLKIKCLLSMLLIQIIIIRKLIDLELALRIWGEEIKL